MSWRDRLARHEAAEQPVADCANSAKSLRSRPIGTNGTIGNEEKTAIAAVTQHPRAPTQMGLSGYGTWLETGIGTGWSDTEDERAAIVEHDGGALREWAEGFAQLDPDRPPGDVPRRRWLQFINDIGRFLDSSFAEQAAALGWGPFDLFCCDRDSPFDRIDKAGLLWLIHGDRLLALTSDAALIETRTGTRQIYRRKPTEPGRVLAWDLLSRGPR
jgi:hypothetical protein